jgi:hypothetical protein
MLAIVSEALPVLVNVMDWAALVVPTCCALKVSEAGDRLTAGADAGGDCDPPEPPPQAIQTQARRAALPAIKSAGRHFSFRSRLSQNRIRRAPSSSIHDEGRRKPDGGFVLNEGGVAEDAVVVTVSVSATGDALVTLTDGVVRVHVAPVGQPLTTLKFTTPVNP